MKNKCIMMAAAMAGLLSFSDVARAGLFDYSSSVGAAIHFLGDGTFSFTPGVNNFKVTDGTAAGLLGEFTGTYTIGTITTSGGVSSAPVTGSGTMVIHDGVFDLTANVQWVDITQSGTGNFLNDSGTVNLTGVTYGGSNPDLQALAAAGSGINVMSFQFIPAVALSSLKTQPHDTSFSGTVVYCSGQIGDFVWNDLNQNGCQDAGEPGIPGVQMDLYAGCPATALIATTNTDSNGHYLFSGLCSGTYTVRFHTPFGLVHTVASQGCGGTPGDLHNPNDSNCQCTQADDCDVCVTLATSSSQDLTIDCGYTNIPPSGDIGCRVTGGSNHETNNYQSACIVTDPPTFVSHGGQVGAPFSVHADFSPYSPCISGEWQHDRHLTKNGLVGSLHASGNGHVHQFDSLLCACLPCPENPSAVGVVGTLCNPGDRICGPEPRRAPANKICFSGVGDYTLGNGNKTLQAVFRVDIEDRSEGNSHSSTPPPDRYRIRIWILGSSCGRNYSAESPAGLLLRLAASADPTKIGNLATTEDLKINITPDIDDGGDMTQGNHQIHPATGATCK